MPDLDLKRYSSALRFALASHQTQRRKGSSVPYITHPVGVSAILAQHGYAEEVVLAGLLHDVIEDAQVLPGELARRFGARVASLVQGVTEQKQAHGKDIRWEVRKAQQLEHLCEADLDVVALKAADALHNVRSITRDLRVRGDSVWSVFKRSRDSQLDYYRAVARITRERIGAVPLAGELHEAVEELAMRSS